MKEKRILPWIIGAVAFAALACLLIFNLGVTHGEYQCTKCDSYGEANAMTLFKHPVWTGAVRAVKAVTPVIAVTSCEHVWGSRFFLQCGVDPGPMEKIRSQLLAVGQSETPTLTSAAVLLDRTAANQVPEDTARKCADPQH